MPSLQITQSLARAYNDRLEEEIAMNRFVNSRTREYQLLLEAQSPYANESLDQAVSRIKGEVKAKKARLANLYAASQAADESFAIGSGATERRYAELPEYVIPNTEGGEMYQPIERAPLGPAPLNE